MRFAQGFGSTLLLIALCFAPGLPVSRPLALGAPLGPPGPEASERISEPSSWDSATLEVPGKDDRDAEAEEDGIEETLTCGVERWAVKTGTDADAGLVNTAQVTPTAITSLRALTAPSTLPASNRVQPTETTVYQLTCTLVEFKAETDNDYHLVLKDAAGNTMIAEIPNPGCVGASSPFLSAITSSRSKFDAAYSATSSFQTVNVPVQVTGVGFFDFLHGQTGVAPNGIELHPILNIVFNPSTSADFSLSASPVSVSVVQGGTGTVALNTAVTGGFSSSVALSATGLPTGVTASFNPSSIAAPGAGSSTLTLAASSMAATVSTPITLTATGGGTTHTATVSLTVTGGGGGTGIVNGGFEGGITGWTAGGIVAPTASTAVVHTGTSSAYIAGGSTAGDSTIYQTLAVPSTGGTLSFWYYPVSADSITYDWQEMDICTTSGTVLTTPLKVCSNTKTWTNVSYNLAAYAGTSVRLLFKVHDDAYQGDATSMYLDDVTLSGSAPPPTTYGISGTITSGGTGLSGVTVTTTGATATTAAGGAYTLNGLANGTYTVTPSLTGYAFTPATASVTISGASSSGVNFTGAASGGTARQILLNPGFESGNNGSWTLSTSPTSHTIITTTTTPVAPHGGTYLATLGQYNGTYYSSQADSIRQTVAVPAGATTASLSFWYYIKTQETTTSSAYDKLTVTVENSSGTVLATLATLSNLNKTSSWTQKTGLSLLAYKGQTVVLRFKGATDSSLGTAFVLDDLSLMANGN